MEQLITFIMDNFFIVVVAVGIIYSLFFRKSPLERNPNRMPDFGEGGRPGQTAPDRQIPPPASIEQPPWMETRQQEGMPAKRNSPIYAPAGAQEKAILQRSQQSKTGFGAEALSRDDLSRAVVWAEILGPPRARRPYRR
ncbi:hypothetical protein [Cohnella sp.]|uniref:hypothetical protein n=1 Tax=Cohnella sp. TaxID=1883426 RepID=UPI0035651FF8